MHCTQSGNTRNPVPKDAQTLFFRYQEDRKLDKLWHSGFQGFDLNLIYTSPIDWLFISSDNHVMPILKPGNDSVDDSGVAYDLLQMAGFVLLSPKIIGLRSLKTFFKLNRLDKVGGFDFHGALRRSDGRRFQPQQFHELVFVELFDLFITCCSEFGRLVGFPTVF